MSRRDRRLARRLVAGDETAFNEFFDGYFPALYRFALSRMRHDADAAEEVAQATMCRVITKLDTYRGEAALFTWLCTFCRHEISAFYRRNNRQPQAVDLAEDNAEITAALDSLWVLTGEGPEHQLQRKEIARLVHVTLDRLPARYADALEWKYIEGLSVKEIATRMELSAKAAESLLTRSRDAFRDGVVVLVAGTIDSQRPYWTSMNDDVDRCHLCRNPIRGHEDRDPTGALHATCVEAPVRSRLQAQGTVWSLRPIRKFFAGWGGSN